MEICDLYDINGNKTGKTIERKAELPAGTYHLGADVWIMNSKGELLIQKRAKSKKTYPDMWAMTCGTASKGENAEQAICREAKEELGIELHQSELEFINKIITPRTIIHIFFVRKDIEIKDLVLQDEEVADAKWATLEEIDNFVSNNQFIKFRWDAVRDIIYNKRK
jgi:isopentenyl-diphosphate delta-isomerase type 1